MAGSDGCTVVENVVRVVSVEEHVVLGIIVTCLAVVFGALLVILCCCCCTKKKRKVDEAVVLVHEEDKQTVQLVTLQESSPEVVIAAAAAEKTVLESSVVYSTGCSVTMPGETGVCCFLDALTKQSHANILEVILCHDLSALSYVEGTLRHEIQLILLHLLTVELENQVAMGNLPQERAQEMISNYEQALEEAGQASIEKCDDDIKQLEANPENPCDAENGLEEAHLAHLDRQRQAQEKLLQEHIFAVLEEILPDEEVEKVIGSLTLRMAKIETHWSSVLMLQLEALGIWLEQRQNRAEIFMSIDEMNNTEIEERLQQFNKDLNILTGNNKLNPDYISSLLLTHEEAVLKVVADHQQLMVKEAEDLRIRMHATRKSNVEKLEADQQERLEKKVEDWCEQVSSGSMSLNNFTDMYKNEVEEQFAEWLELHKTHDDKECKQLEELRKEFSDNYHLAVDKEENLVYKKLIKQAQLSKKDGNDLLEKHKRDTQHIIVTLRKENEDRKEELKTRRLAAVWASERQQLEGEREQFVQLQLEAVTRMLEKQAGITPSIHKRVLAEYKCGTIGYANRYLVSKIRQRKRLDHRLTQQRVRLVLLQQKHDEEKRLYKQQKHIPLETIMQRQNEEYIVVQKELDREEFAARNELTLRLVQQTEDAIALQDMKLGLLMGKLQADSLKKQEVMAQEEATVIDIRRKVLESVALPEEETHVILEQHKREMERMTHSRKESRNHQMKVMNEKLQAKKFKKEKELGITYSIDVKQSKTRTKKKSTAFTRTATVILAEVIGKQQQKQALETMTQELELERTRITRELNEQMEQQMKKDMQEVEKNVITEMAVKGKLSEKELEELVKQCTPTGTNCKVTVKYSGQLSDDLKNRSRILSASSVDSHELDK